MPNMKNRVSQVHVGDEVCVARLIHQGLCNGPATQLCSGWWMLWRYSAVNSYEHMEEASFLGVRLKLYSCWIFNGLTPAEFGDFPKSFIFFHTLLAK